MTTGVAEIDRRRRILLDILSEATTMLADGREYTRSRQFTRDLLAYAICSFSSEEELMRQYHYASLVPAEAATHRTEHRRFSEQIVEFHALSQENHQWALDRLVAFLNHWVASHHLQTDMRLGHFVQAARQRATAAEPNVAGHEK